MPVWVCIAAGFLGGILLIASVLYWAHSSIPGTVEPRSRLPEANGQRTIESITGADTVQP